MHASAYPLATCIFGFQNCWWLYLASANGRGRNWTRKKNKKQIGTHSWMVQFFSFWGQGPEGFFFPLVPNVFLSCPQMVSQFSMSLHQVPKLFLDALQRMFSIAPGFCPVWCAKSSIPMDINWKGDNPGEHTCFYFATQDPKRCFYWGHGQCSDKIADGPTNMVPLEIKTRL
jgi:hypothetical protein